MPKPINSIYRMSGAASGMGSPDFNNLSARVSRLEDVTPLTIRGNSFAGQGRNKFFPIDSTGLVRGKLNLGTASGISFQGTLAPNVIDGQFTVACPSDSSATIYYDGTNSSRVFVIRRADKTTSTVPGSNITITGLTNSLTYQAIAYWVPFNACGMSWSPGTHGTPQIAFLSTDSDTTFAQGVAVQSLAGNEPIGIITWTQPGSGGTSSASDPLVNTTRQSGSCVRLGTHIEVLGSWGKSDVSEVQHANDKWVHLETDRGLVLECTPNHNLYHDENGKMEARYFVEGDPIITRFGVQTISRVYPFIHGCVKVQVKMKHGHLFWANSFLSHNSKLPLS